MSVLLNSIIKSIISGLIVSLTTYFIMKQTATYINIILIGLTAAIISLIIDFFASRGKINIPHVKPKYTFSNSAHLRQPIRKLNYLNPLSLLDQLEFVVTSKNPSPCLNIDPLPDQSKFVFDPKNPSPLLNIDPLLDLEHLSNSVKADPLSKLPEPKMTNKELKQRAMALFNKINFTHNKIDTGFINEADRFEDDMLFHPSRVVCKKTRNDKRNVIVFKRLKKSDLYYRYYDNMQEAYTMGDYNCKESLRYYFEKFFNNAIDPKFRKATKKNDLKKLKITIQCLEDDTVEILTKNRTLVDFALASVHCSTRFEAQVNKALRTVLYGSEKSNETFEEAVDRSLLNWRERLIIEHFMKNAPPTEFGHVIHYWLQLLGQYFGLPNHPPDPEMKFVSAQWLGEDVHLTLVEALNIIYKKYTLSTVKDHIHNVIFYPDKFLKPEQVGFDKLNTWAQQQNIPLETILNADLTALTDEGMNMILSKLGGYIIKKN